VCPRPATFACAAAFLVALLATGPSLLPSETASAAASKREPSGCRTTTAGPQGGAYVFFDGFESGDARRWDRVAGKPRVQRRIRYRGSYALQAGARRGALTRPLPASARLSVAFCLRFAGRGGVWPRRGEQLLRLGSNRIALLAGPAGRLELRRGSRRVWRGRVPRRLRRGWFALGIHLDRNARRVKVGVNGRSLGSARPTLRAERSLTLGSPSRRSGTPKVIDNVTVIAPLPPAPAAEEGEAPGGQATGGAPPPEGNAPGTAPLPLDEPPSAPGPRPGADRLFATDSVWNRALGRHAPIDRSSPELVGAFVESVREEIRRGIGPWIATWEYSTPIYRVPRDQPAVRVALDDGTRSWRRTLQAAYEQVPIPPGAKAARGTDGHLTVWQPSTDRLWEFWHARQDASGAWHASWGGAIERVSESPGYYTNDSWPGSGPNWGASATSLPVAAGTMTIEDLRRGRIDHALAIALPYPRKDIYAWPAQRTDGTGTSPNSIPAGAQLRIDPELDLDKLEMPRITRIMAGAVQRHGMIVRDRTGHALQFYAEDPAQYGYNPYKGPEGFFQGDWPAELLASFPWEHLQVIEMDLRRER
jgi:hypothetical protein